jgi:hypothetical protein
MSAVRSAVRRDIDLSPEQVPLLRNYPPSWAFPQITRYNTPAVSRRRLQLQLPAQSSISYTDDQVYHIAI